jgi:hypothetical protein
MKTNQLLKASFALATGLLLSSAASQAASYKVTINTSALNLPPASPSGPFSVDFQFNSGDTLNNNTAIISNFIFGGGSASSGGVASGLGVTGNLGGTITIADTEAFNSYYEGFAPGTTFEFDLQLTENADAGATPDSFSFAILDSSLGNITTDGIGNSLFQVDIVPGAMGVGDLNLGTGTGSFAGVTITAIPEPSAAMLGVVACGLGMLRRRRSA